MKWIQRKPKVKPTSNDSVVDFIAKVRGITDTERFLSPTSDELHDPYLLKNIEKASNRIIMAIKKNERIVVSYDPDADGITATTIMLRYLSHYTQNVDFIYGERNDGHGIYEMVRVSSNDDVARTERNLENAEKIKNCDLLILIDSSSNDTEACGKIVDSVGCDIIILDHHAIERENPHVIMVNPQQEDCEYPNKHLSGAGVVFKTLQVMEDTLGEVDPWQFIDLVAVGMYADVMRVDILENRYLIMHGLRNMKNTGLLRILKGGKVDLYKINCNAIGFTIAPLLNGVARMDNIKLAIDILMTDDDSVAKKLRLQMEKLNNLRKEKQREIINQYMTKVDSSQKVLLVLDEQSSKGFNGIVAQQLAEKYKRPTIVGRLHKGTVSGSFRSYNGFEFKSFLNSFNGEMEALGHEGAGGIVIAEDLLENLKQFIDEQMPSLEDTEPTIIYDLEMTVDEIGDYIQAVEQFNLLTGNGFPRIVVRVNGITVEEVVSLGKGEVKETRKIKTFDDMEAIRFRTNEQYASELGYFDEIDVVGQLSMNEWYNFQTKIKTSTPQIILDDYKKR